MRNHRVAILSPLVLGALLVLTLASPAVHADGTAPASATSRSPVAAEPPNIFVYNLDDLRDEVPGGVDPLDYMPKVTQWMQTGVRYEQSFVVDPACCPSRASLMTGRYPHNNGVRLQSQGPSFDYQHSMACYFDSAGYETFVAGKFLTTWPKTLRPPCFDHSTVMWSGYHNSQMRLDGVLRRSRGYSTTVLGAAGRAYITDALDGQQPFLLYETPQAPHWVTVQNPDGTSSRLAVPEAQYASAPVAPCAGPVESDRSDKPAYVRRYSQTTAQGQAMCASQLRAIMTADDEFDATMQLLQDRGVLKDTLVVFTSDNGYMWSDHGRTEKFVPYEPSIRVPMLLRWPGNISAGTDQTRQVSYLDVLPTLMEAAGVSLPPGAPPLDGESLLSPSQRTTMYAEYYRDTSNDKTPTWRMVRTPEMKYVQTYDQSGNVTFREYYRLSSDPTELTNVLADGNPGNDPPSTELAALAAEIDTFASCSGRGCVR